MSDRYEDDDPFVDQDPAAAERAARRRAREERRRARAEGTERSLGERVSGLLDGLRAGGEGEEPAWARGERAAAEPEPRRSFEAEESPAEPELPADRESEPGEEERRFETGELDAALQFDPDPAFDPGSAEGPQGDYEPYDEQGEGFDGAYEDVPDGGAPVPQAEAYGRPRGRWSDPGAGEEEVDGGRRLAGLGAGGVALLSDPMIRRRIIAGAGFVAIIGILLALLASGGGEEQPVAAPVEPIETIDVVVPEGLTLDAMARVAKQAKLKGSYRKATNRQLDRFPLRKYDAEGAPSLEGFLYPATYELEKGAEAGQLVRKQLEAFEQNFSQVNTRRAKRGNLTDYDVVKIASMIEREVSVPRERKLVSAVIYNRLQAGNPLGIDATLRYELDNFDEPLLESELQADTPYNTRTNAGLPPTPIGNPGLDALEAAANPADVDFFYYVIEPGTCNEHVFTESAEEFEQAVAAYQAALEEEGGSPTEC